MQAIQNNNVWGSWMHTTISIAGNIGGKNIWQFWTDLNIGGFKFRGYLAHLIKINSPPIILAMWYTKDYQPNTMYICTYIHMLTQCIDIGRLTFS